MFAMLTWEGAAVMCALSAPITAAIISRRPANQGVTRGELQVVEKRLIKKIDELHTDIRELRRVLLG